MREESEAGLRSTGGEDAGSGPQVPGHLPSSWPFPCGLWGTSEAFIMSGKVLVPEGTKEATPETAAAGSMETPRGSPAVGGGVCLLHILTMGQFLAYMSLDPKAFTMCECSTRAVSYGMKFKKRDSTLKGKEVLILAVASMNLEDSMLIS